MICGHVGMLPSKLRGGNACTFLEFDAHVTVCSFPEIRLPHSVATVTWVSNSRKVLRKCSFHWKRLCSCRIFEMDHHGQLQQKISDVSGSMVPWFISQSVSALHLEDAWLQLGSGLHCVGCSTEGSAMLLLAMPPLALEGSKLFEVSIDCFSHQCTGACPDLVFSFISANLQSFCWLQH